MSSLKKMNEAEVISPDGFKVKYGKDSLTYVDGSKYLVVPIEHLATPYEMVVFMNMTSNWMDKGVSVGKPSETDLDIVEQRIRDSLRFLQRNFSISR